MSNWTAYWNDVSKAPIERLVQWWKERFGYSRFTRYVPHKSKVLEVGSGKGVVSRLLRNCDVVTSDIDPECGADFTFDTKKIPFSNKSFDVVMSTGLLEHFEDWECVGIIREQLRVGKTVIFNVPERSRWWPLLWGVRRLFGAKLDLHFNLKNASEMRQFLRDSGIKGIVSREVFGVFPYLVVKCNGLS